jgi:hypothetical protein
MFFPMVRKKFNRNVNCIEKWMTKGLLISRKNKMLLGKKSFSSPSPVNTLQFKNFRNLYNRVVTAAKKMYYDQQFKINQSNLKKTCELIFE